jgi:hypothetical protein
VAFPETVARKDNAYYPQNMPIPSIFAFFSAIYI